MQTHKPQTAAQMFAKAEPPRANPARWILQAISRMVRAHLKRRRDRRAYRQLLQLPDYLLKDMGLPRRKVHHRLMRMQLGRDGEIERPRPARRSK